MIRSYFDLDAIGACEEPVPVTFTVPSFNMGRDLTVRTPEGEAVAEVAAGCVTTLPLWAATALRTDGYISVHAPQKFSLATFREFKTDPLAPSLQRKSPYFYEVGLQLCRLLSNPTSSGHMSAEGNRLAAQLFRLYQLRYLRIIFAAAKKGFDLNDVRDKLEESERCLLDTYLRGQAEEALWYASFT
ncbi:GINS complex subunit Psf3 [Novymonas esmeraldas]|uniref:GINS complex subunit Psf3 n=1 Tax=Novymonas esmeraldas TaxID=1808958 RepID=A0AAW0EY68_9TRYP